MPRQSALVGFFDAAEFERVVVKMRFLLTVWVGGFFSRPNLWLGTTNIQLLPTGSRSKNITTKILLSPFDKIEEVINNPLMQNEAEQYKNSPDFREFLNREFDHTAANATIEELAEFAFGSIEEAIEAYEKHKKDVA